MKIFSGVRPTGGIHIGNYLGAIQNWVNLQEKNDCVFCVVDWHAITTPYKTEELEDNIYETALAYLVAGIDPEKSIFFLQSQVKEHLELAWYLSTVLPVSELQRMTQFKEKSDKSPKSSLLNYPVLMAADILIYDAETVPVGDDQVQHVELTREAARRFNNRFGEKFKEPEAIVPETTARIMSLSDPQKKMSKSGNPKGTIGLFEEPELIEKKIMGAVTDNDREVRYDPENKAGISNLLNIYSAFSDKDVSEIADQFDNYKEFKEATAKTVINALEPFRSAKKDMSTTELKKILLKGSKQVQKLAENKMSEVRKKMGFNLG